MLVRCLQIAGSKDGGDDGTPGRSAVAWLARHVQEHAQLGCGERFCGCAGVPPQGGTSAEREGEDGRMCHLFGEPNGGT